MWTHSVIMACMHVQTKRAGPCPPPDTALIGDGDRDAEVDRHCQLPLASLSVSTGIHPRVTQAS